MRIIVSFNGGGLTINFDDIEEIYNYSNHIRLVGKRLTIVVNGVDICSMGAVEIQKSWLFSADRRLD